jgi:hypothetical protein
VAQNRWAVFVMHNYTAGKGTALTEIFDYLVANDVDVVTVDEVIANCKYL